MKYLFIVNPIAGGIDRSDSIRALAEKTFQSRNTDSYEIYITKYKGDDTREVRERAVRGEELRILACGGDGTFNGCCNGAAGYFNIAVCPFPSGTGNDFCRMFGDEKDLYHDLNAILDGSTHLIDLVQVNDTFCACIASCGFDARVGSKVHNYTHLPFCKGPGGYIAALVAELMHGLCMNMKITCGEYAYEGPATLCCICNGRHYGGGFNPSPDAMPDDGILDIYLVKKISLFRFFSGISKYAKGRGKETGFVTHLRQTKLILEFDQDAVINCDGEILCSHKAELQIVPRCLNLIVPKGVTFFNSQL